MEDLIRYVDWRYVSEDTLKKYGTLEFFNKYKDMLDSSYYKHIIPTDELFRLLLKNDYPILENINMELNKESIEFLIESIRLGDVCEKISKRIMYNVLEVGENILTPQQLSMFNLKDNIEVVMKSKAIVTIANKDIEYFLNEILTPQLNKDSVNLRYYLKDYGICGCLDFHNQYVFGMAPSVLTYKILEIAKDIPLDRLFLKKLGINNFITAHMDITKVMADPRFAKYINDNKHIKVLALNDEIDKMSKKEFMKIIPYLKLEPQADLEFFGVEKYHPNNSLYYEKSYMLKFELTESDMIRIKTMTTYNMCSYILKLYLRQHAKDKKHVPDRILKLYDKHLGGMKTLLSQCRVNTEYFFNNPDYFNLKYMKDNIDDYEDSEDISLYLKMLNI